MPANAEKQLRVLRALAKNPEAARQLGAPPGVIRQYGASDPERTDSARKPRKIAPSEVLGRLGALNRSNQDYVLNRLSWSRPPVRLAEGTDVSIAGSTEDRQPPENTLTPSEAIPVTGKQSVESDNAQPQAISVEGVDPDEVLAYYAGRRIGSTPVQAATPPADGKPQPSPPSPLAPLKSEIKKIMPRAPLDQDRISTLPRRLAAPMSFLGHYVEGSGEPLYVPFEDIDTSEITPSSFPAVQEILRSGIPGTYDIRDATREFTTRLPETLYFGNITPLLNGTLTVLKSGTFAFHGALGSKPDRYDFNASKHRGALAEFSTTLGRQVPGTPYGVTIYGTRGIHETGNVFSPK
jgi:Colicin M